MIFRKSNLGPCTHFVSILIDNHLAIVNYRESDPVPHGVVNSTRGTLKDFCKDNGFCPEPVPYGSPLSMWFGLGLIGDPRQRGKTQREVGRQGWELYTNWSTGYYEVLKMI